jgi:uncharacterized protein with FMN-binding domain
MRRVILAIVSTVVVLVILLSIKTHSVGSLATTPPAAVGTPSGSASGPGTGSGSGPTSGSGSGSGASPTPSSGTSSGTGSGSATGAASAKTVTGDASNTMYGPVQVQITVKSRKITAVNVIQYPNGTPRDAQINAFAIPQLTQETLAANSASIDMISGATYTSNGYISSLQSALDKAGI